MPSLRYLVLVPDWIIVLACFFMIASAGSCVLLYLSARRHARQIEALYAAYGGLSAEHDRLRREHRDLRIDHRELVTDLAREIPDDLYDAPK
jgi:cell division protein FtsB